MPVGDEDWPTGALCQAIGSVDAQEFDELDEADKSDAEQDVLLLFGLDHGHEIDA